MNISTLGESSRFLSPVRSNFFPFSLRRFIIVGLKKKTKKNQSRNRFNAEPLSEYRFNDEKVNDVAGTCSVGRPQRVKRLDRASRFWFGQRCIQVHAAKQRSPPLKDIETHFFSSSPLRSGPVRYRCTTGCIYRAVARATRTLNFIKGPRRHQSFLLKINDRHGFTATRLAEMHIKASPISRPVACVCVCVFARALCVLVCVSLRWHGAKSRPSLGCFNDDKKPCSIDRRRTGVRNFYKFSRG